MSPGSERVGALTLAALNLLLLILRRPLVALLNKLDLFPSQFLLSLLPKRRKRRSLPPALRLIRHGGWVVRWVMIEWVMTDLGPAQNGYAS